LRFVKTRSGRRVSAGLTSATDARTTRLRRTQRPHPPLPTGEMPMRGSGESLETPVVCASVRSLTGEPALRPRSRPTPLRPPHPTPRP
jgi:hypothetical protein